MNCNVYYYIQEDQIQAVVLIYYLGALAKKSPSDFLSFSMFKQAEGRDVRVISIEWGVTVLVEVHRAV